MRALRAMTFAVSLAWASVATAQTSPTEIARRDLLDQAEAARAPPGPSASTSITPGTTG